ncbi:MAG TPA: hypothetical protein VM487_09620 [Phycisphaerae bacterium]|nr:hypothetical protein [Phycisphaerae bacterium]
MSTANQATTPGSSSVALQWGKGVDRSSGAIGEDPTKFTDLRNLLFTTTGVRMRGGLGSPVEAITGVDHVCFITTFREVAKSIAVCYNQTTKLVTVWEGNLLGAGWTLVGEWGDLDAEATAPPQFTAAETYGVLMLTHDEPNVTHRLPTMVYDPTLPTTNVLITHPGLRYGSTDPKKVKWIAFDVENSGTVAVTSAELALTGTINAGLWGMYLIEVTAGGVVSFLAPASPQAYGTEGEALAAKPTLTAGSVEVGYFTLQAASGPVGPPSNWVGGTNNLTTDPAQLYFTDGPVQPWCALFANLDNTYFAPVKYRGVAQWLGYIWGWGFGSNGDPDRPEIVRVSDADDPTRYEPNWYIKVGARSEAVIAASPVGSSFAVFKTASWHRIDGSSRDDWGPVLVDGAVGCVSARAALTVAGTVFWWSTTGPRSSTGESTIDGGLDLDLTGPLPNDLPAPGGLERTFVVYYPDDRHAVFYVPDLTGSQTLGFRVSMRQDGGGERWAFDLLGALCLHGAVIEAGGYGGGGTGGGGGGGGTIPPGYATAATTTGSAGSGLGSIIYEWTTNASVGDETIELWYKPTAGSWVKVKEIAYGSINPAAPTATFGPSATVVAGAFETQIRYRRAGGYYTGYSATDPDLWPAGSLASGTVAIIGTVTGVTVSYDFTTGDVTVDWTAGDPTQAQDVQIEEVGVTSPASDLASVTAGVFTKVFPLASATSTAARANGVQITAKVRQKDGAIVGAWAAAAVAADAFWDGAHVAGMDWSYTGYRASVALGTDIDLSYGAPPSVVGNWTFELLDTGNLGAYPPNGGCGLSFPIGGGYFFPAVYPVAMYGPVTQPDTELGPVLVTHLPVPSCGVCHVVAQVVGMGNGQGIWRFSEAGTLEHRTHPAAFFHFLPGSNFGYAVGVVCGP